VCMCGCVCACHVLKNLFMSLCYPLINSSLNLSCLTKPTCDVCIKILMKHVDLVDS